MSKKWLVSVLALGLLCTGCKAQQKANAGSEMQQTLPPQKITEQALFPTDTVETEISLSLPDDFQEVTGKPFAKAYNHLYANGQMGVGVIRLAKPNAFSLEDYANRDAEYFRTELIQKDGFLTLRYEDLDSNEPQTFVNVYYESADAFYTVQGYCTSQSFSQYEALLWQYITSGVISEK